MRADRRDRWRAGRRLAWMGVGLGIVAMAGSGCSGGPTLRDEARFAGPEIALDSAARHHQIVVQAPSPGWGVEFDGTRPTADSTDLLVSLRRPNPAFAYPQMIVEQNLRTEVRSTEPVRVFARIIDHDERRNSREPYDLVPLAATTGGEERGG